MKTVRLESKVQEVTTALLQQLLDKKELKQMALLKKGNRLSIMPISAQEFAVITALSE